MIEKKIRMGTCEECHEKMEYRLLCTIVDKKICLACGTQEIDKWNKMVAEAESANSDERKGSV